MKVLKSQIRLTALVLSFVFTNTVLAVEPTKNENKDNGTADTISNADLTNNAGGDAAAPVEAQASTAVNTQPDAQPQAVNDSQSYRKQFEERRRQAQQAQLESYKKFLERRKQYLADNPVPEYGNQEFNNRLPADVQERRAAFIKEMEERRALNIKMMEERRKAADERRKAMQLKMYQTNTSPEVAAPEKANKV